MAYEIEEIRLSQQIFYYLLEHFELREEASAGLYRAYVEMSRCSFWSRVRERRRAAALSGTAT